MSSVHNKYINIAGVLYNSKRIIEIRKIKISFEFQRIFFMILYCVFSPHPMPHLILINGPSCVGKSSSIKSYMRDHDHLYYLSYDAQKWGFSHYTEHKDEYSKMITDIFFGISDRVMQEWLNIICDSVIERSTRTYLSQRAAHYGYMIIEINLEAPWDTIQDRFYQRIKTWAQENPEPISNTSLKRLSRIFELYEQEKNPNAYTLSTLDIAIDTIAWEITEEVERSLVLLNK